MERRLARINSSAAGGTAGAGAKTHKVTLPSRWLQTMGITDDEREVLFNNLHSYRGDRSEYILRSTMTRIIYADRPFPAHNTVDMVKGDVLIDNVGYGQYKGETQIALQPMKNDGRVNVVGKISDDELFLLDFLRPWSNFKLVEAK